MKHASDWQKEISTHADFVRLIQLDALETALSAVEQLDRMVDLRGGGFFKAATCRAIEEVMRETEGK